MVLAPARRALLLGFAAAWIAGCGGGGSDGGVAPPAPSGAADLQVTAGTQATRVIEGGTATYTMTVANLGPAAARDVAITASLDAGQGLGAVSCSAAGGAACPATLGAAMTVASLPKDGALTFTVTASVPVTGADRVLTGALSVQSAADSQPANNAAGASVVATRPNFIRLRSEIGDYVGAGGSYDYTRSNAEISVAADAGRLDLRIRGDESWTAIVGMPVALARIQPGTYPNMTRLAFQSPASGGFDWFGEGRSCNTVAATLIVHGASYVNGALDAIHFSFEQRCEGGVAALRGEVHWSTADTTRPPGPVAPPAGLWQPPAGATPATGNYVYLQSDAGEYVGGGGTYLYTPANAVLSATSSNGLLQIAVNGNENWRGSLQTMAGIPQVLPGYYGDLRRFPFHNPTRGGLDWSGEGRGCNSLQGWFAIDSIAFTGNAVSAVELRFEQRCDGSTTAALRGKLRWSAGDTSMPPGPVNPPPAGLWQPPAGATPASGSYVYLQSDAGDYVGQGATHLYTPTGGVAFNATAGSGRFALFVLLAGLTEWRGDFQAMVGVAQLQPGYYGGLQRYPFHNPAAGGLDWSGQGRGCNTLQGWFVVDSVSYDSFGLASITLRFEQHCEGAVPALRGKLVWAR